MCVGRYSLIPPEPESLQYLHTAVQCLQDLENSSTMLPYAHGRVPKQTLIYSNIYVVVREIPAFPNPLIFPMQERNFSVRKIKTNKETQVLLYLL